MTLWQDLRYALRTLRKTPAFTIVAALTLALGIGANTAMFSVIRVVFLQPLSFPNEDRLVSLWASNPELGSPRELVTPANFVDWQAQNSVFEQMGVWPGVADSVVDFNIVEKDGAERVRGVYASSGVFRALGVQPVLGRTFFPNEDRVQDHRSALISHSYWRERFAGDPAVLGKTINVDTFRGGIYTIVGVLPPGFDFPPGSHLFLPLAFWGGGPLPLADAVNRCCPWFNAVGLLKPGVTLDRAQNEMTAIARRVSERHPNVARVTAVRMAPLRDEMIGSHRTALFALFGAVGCVLLIACVNVANLVLSRVLARRGEMVIRSALGASTFRLVRQVLVESLVLSALGAAAGILAAVWTQGLLVASLAAGLPLAARATMDWRVLLFAAAITLTTAGFCGLTPVAQLAAGALRSSLQGRTRSHTETPRGSGLRQVLVVTEVALAVALVAAAGLLIRSLARMESVNPGFHAERALAVSFDFTASPFRGPGNQQPFFHDLLTRVAGLPGVRTTGAISEAPLIRRRMPNQPMTVEGRPPLSNTESPKVMARAVTPDYFPAMGVPLKKGRLFTEADSGDGKLVAIPNETAARLLWPGEDPIGKRLAIGSGERFAYFRAPPGPTPRPEWREVVGVVADMRSSGLDLPAQPEVFYSYRQFPWYNPTLVVRTQGDPLQLAAAIRRETLALNSRAVITDVKTMEQIVAGSTAQPRFRARLIALFSTVALLLGVLGIYGVTSYSVEQRRQEIAVRMALGATIVDVLRLILFHAMRATAIGVALGIAGALIAARWISSLLYGVSPADPLTLIGACVLFVTTALAASYLPARRAAAVDPAAALRNE